MNSTNKNNSNVVESENIIELKNITKQYEDLVVLDNLNLDIKKNEFLTLLGPSGCGKTTTLKIIAGFEHADEGEVMFEGENVNDTPPYERQVNTVFQKYALFPHMNVYENIVLPIELDGGKVNKDFVQQIVQTLGLDDRLDALPNQLSGGQQQRVAIARALAAAPAIILADEPTGNLDSKTSQDVLSLLKVTSQKFAQTIVMITHNEEIAQMADRIIRIEDGRIVSQN